MVGRDKIKRTEKKSHPRIIIVITALLLFTSKVHSDFLHNDDVIVKGSICVGVDCSSGETFNFDTIRLKENNLRIKFIDTSNASGFPTRDWEISANESANGGLNNFAIFNVDNERYPFTILDNAEANSIYVHTGSRVGLSTSAPAMQLHAVTGNTPTFRLDQDASSGFTSQAWDIGGNESNFFVRDATNNGIIPFKIQPKAPANSIYVAADGDVGFETASPDGQFDIAHATDNNNHAFLVSPSSLVGVNIDNGFLPRGLFDVQTTGGVSRFMVQSDGRVGLGLATSGTATGLFDVQVSGTSKFLINDAGNTTVSGGMTINSTLNNNTYINSTGSIGVGVTDTNDFVAVLGVSPSIKLQTGTDHSMLQLENSDVNYTSGLMFTAAETMKWYLSARNSFNSGNDAFFFIDSSASVPTLALFQDKTIGLGGIQAAVSGKSIVHQNGAYLSSGGTWMDGSSREYKTDIQNMNLEDANKALDELNPITFEYLKEPGETYAGFIAEDVPEIVASADRKAISSMEVVAVLTKVVKDQQETIRALNDRLKTIENKVNR